MPMNEGPEQPADNDERRARVIAQLVEKAVSSPDPVGWVRDFTLRGLEASPSKEKSQREWLIDAARSIGVDESGKEFERLFATVVPPKQRPSP